MRPDCQFLHDKFGEWNAACFGGLLPVPRFELTLARTYRGQLAWKITRNSDGTRTYHDFRLKISVIDDLPEDEVVDTLIHEMIHLAIKWRGIDDTSAHGQLFRNTMKTINARFGRHVTISDRKPPRPPEDAVPRPCHFAVVTLKGGETGLVVTPQSRIFRRWNEVARCPDIVEAQWYYAVDAFFNRFPRSMKFCVYKVDGRELEAHVAQATRLVRHGRYISPDYSLSFEK